MEATDPACGRTGDTVFLVEGIGLAALLRLHHVDVAVTLGSVHIPWVPLALLSWPQPRSAWPGSAALRVGLLHTPPLGWRSLGLSGRFTGNSPWLIQLVTLALTPAVKVHPVSAWPRDPPSPAFTSALCTLSCMAGRGRGGSHFSPTQSRLLPSPTLRPPTLLEPLEMCEEGSGKT